MNARRFVKNLERRVRLGIIAGKLFNTYRDYNIFGDEVIYNIVKYDAWNDFGIDLEHQDVEYIILEMRNLERIVKKNN